MTLNDLLNKEKIDPETVIVFRHRPKEVKLRRVLPWLAAEHPAVFNAYQQNQGEKVEKSMQSAKYVASFIGMKPGTATFCGIYEVKGWETKTVEDCERIAEVVKLYEHGMGRIEAEGKRPQLLWFDLRITSLWNEWKGKLIVKWPGLERSWMRWASNNVFPIEAIREESAFDAEMPAWDELMLTWDELQVMPTPWKNRLREWRGIYFIRDSVGKRGYVGSAYGHDNLLGRWMNYAVTGHGGNKHLKSCSAKDLVFSILQRLSPDCGEEETVRIENSWKKRLHTVFPNGLNDS